MLADLFFIVQGIKYQTIKKKYANKCQNRRKKSKTTVRFFYIDLKCYIQLLDTNLTLNIFEIATHNSIRYRLVRGRNNRELEYRKAEV